MSRRDSTVHNGMNTVGFKASGHRDVVLDAIETAMVVLFGGRRPDRTRNDSKPDQREEVNG